MNQSASSFADDACKPGVDVDVLEHQGFRAREIEQLADDAVAARDAVADALAHWLARFDEEITARVANKQRGLLRIEQLSGELVSATEALKAETNLNAIIDATESTMKNQVEGMLAEFLSKIEALIAKMDAETVDAAGIEMFLTEYEKQLATLDELVKNGLPTIDTVFLDKLSQDSIIPDIDVLEQLLTGSGIRKMLEKLKEGRKDGTGSNNFDAISKEAAALDANQLIQSIQQQLAETTAETGIDTAAYTPEAIARKIDAIAVEIASAETSTEITTSAVTAA